MRKHSSVFKTAPKLTLKLSHLTFERFVLHLQPNPDKNYSLFFNSAQLRRYLYGFKTNIITKFYPNLQYCPARLIPRKNTSALKEKKE